jgi:hemerythrin-like domain-containing protein
MTSSRHPRCEAIVPQTRTTATVNRRKNRQIRRFDPDQPGQFRRAYHVGRAITHGHTMDKPIAASTPTRSERRERAPDGEGTRMKSINIILDEHRSQAAVLHGMLYLVRAIRDSKATPDFRLFSAMMYYIDAFPERFHHPKEETYLFRLLRLRCPSARDVLDRLHEEHQSGDRKIRELEVALRRYEHGGPDQFGDLLAAVESYAAFHWEHMRVEEDQVLPLAREHLTPADWDEIDDAFSGNADPLLDIKAGTEYDALFRRIVHLAPPPIGVGPER